MMLSRQPLNLCIDFLGMSRKIGSDPMLIQGAGGNTSIKHGRTMSVKASGQWLCEAGHKNIFIEVDVETGLPVHSEEQILRPSIETGLHLALPHKIVVHLHSVNALAWLVRQDAKPQLDRLLSGMEWGWIPYVKPGKELAADIRTQFECRPANIYLLQNHGVVVAADDVDGINLLIGEIERRLQNGLPVMQSTSDSFIGDLSAGLDDWRMPKYHEVHHLALFERSRKLVAKQAMFPDQVVFLGEAPLVCKSLSNIKKDLAKYVSLHGNKPGWLIIEGRGVIVPKNFSAGAEELLQCLSRVVMRIPPEVKISYLRAESVSALLNWDAEKYRQNLESNT